MSERPLDQVLVTAVEDFEPERPDRAPWHRSTLRHVEHAYTGNVVTVPLVVADRVHLGNVDRASDERDDLEWFDSTPAGWGVAPRSETF